VFRDYNKGHMKIQNFLILLSICFLYSAQIYLRFSFGIFNEEAISQFHIGSAEYSFFIAIFYLGYAFMQIPFGYLADGKRYQNPIYIFIGIGGLATLFIFFTNSYCIAVLLRLFIGIGAAASMVAITQTLKQYFNTYYKYLFGAIVSIGLLLYAALVYILSSQQDSIKFAYYLIGIVSIVISIILVFFVEKPLFASKLPTMNKLVAISNIDKEVFILSIISMLFSGVMAGFVDAWGQEYLRLSFKLDYQEASLLIALIISGFATGSLLLPALAKTEKYCKRLIWGCGMLICSIMTFIIIAPSFSCISLYMLRIIMFFLGGGCSYHVLLFILLYFIYPNNVSFYSAILNTLTMLGAFIHHFIIGMVFNFSADANINNLLLLNSGLTVVPISSGIGLILLAYYSFIFSLRKQTKEFFYCERNF